MNFDVLVDHLALTHIMKNKLEPSTNRIKRLLEGLKSYTFSLYCLKGKSLVLSDFLQGWKEISVNLMRLFPYHLILSFFNLPSYTYRVITRSQNKAGGTQIPKVNAADKVLNQALKPETQARRKGDSQSHTSKNQINIHATKDNPTSTT